MAGVFATTALVACGTVTAGGLGLLLVRYSWVRASNGHSRAVLLATGGALMWLWIARRLDLTSTRSFFDGCVLYAVLWFLMYLCSSAVITRALQRNGADFYNDSSMLAIPFRDTFGPYPLGATRPPDMGAMDEREPFSPMPSSEASRQEATALQPPDKGQRENR